MAESPLPFQIFLNPRNAKLFQRLYTNLYVVGQANEDGLQEVHFRIDNSVDVRSLLSIGKIIGATTFSDPIKDIAIQAASDDSRMN